jgi:2-keto-3-deoxy-L-rhamnonate aldolase RhmA
MMTYRNTMKAALRDGQVVYGSWLALGSPAAAEIMAHAGHDFLMIDGEHSAVGLETVQAMACAMKGTRCTPLMRVSSNDPSKIKQALDVGLQGVIVPMVNSAAEASAAVSACLYPLQGIRGIASSRASLWGADLEGYAKAANQETCVIVQIEHPDAVDRVDEILAVPGIDVAYIGVADLASFMGFAGQVGELDPRVDQAIDHVVDAARRAGVALGIHCLTAASAHRRIRQGFRYLVVGGDARYLGGGARNMLRELKAMAAEA